MDADGREKKINHRRCGELAEPFTQTGTEEWKRRGQPQITRIIADKEKKVELSQMDGRRNSHKGTWMFVQCTNS